MFLTTHKCSFKEKAISLSFCTLYTFMLTSCVGLSKFQNACVVSCRFKRDCFI